MSPRGRNSKRETKIPSKLLDTDYDGTKVKQNNSKAKGREKGERQSNRNKETIDARVCSENVVVDDKGEDVGCLDRNVGVIVGNRGCLDAVEFPTLNESVKMKRVNGKDIAENQREGNFDDKVNEGLDRNAVSIDDKVIQQECEKQIHHCTVSQASTSVNVQSTETVKTNVDGCTNDVSEQSLPESEPIKCNEKDKSNQNDVQSNGEKDSAKQNKNTKKSYAKVATSNVVNKGISALASRVGKPVIMDAATAIMCQVGVIRGGYARVLVEVQAHKELPTKIDVLYKNSLNEVIGTKIVQVAYCWKPPSCKRCGVFGHNDDSCPKLVDSNNGIKGLGKEVELDGVKEVENRKANRQNGMNNGNNKMQQGNNNAKGYFGNKGNVRKNEKGVFKPKQSSNPRDKCSNKQKENDKERNVNKRNSNQFEVLGNLEEETREILDMEARGIVDVFVNQKRKPTAEEQAKWNEDMLCYFRARWDALVINNKVDCQNNQGCNNEVEDVYTDQSGIGLSMEKNEVIGSDANTLQDC
ncbi:zinc knuckle CX2CX4HX4C [Artemisia annua]|uniref:Zinc knuckle CX2CX4HX4C n=1 Tax=Artemisia annua TaxID=35608 RepID=A0A2U1P0U5_ARTAN|nr:zinc knuckle CX2CX4HX4C [Artemisia annua]